MHAAGSGGCRLEVERWRARARARVWIKTACASSAAALSAHLPCLRLFQRQRGLAAREPRRGPGCCRDHARRRACVGADVAVGGPLGVLEPMSVAGQRGVESRRSAWLGRLGVPWRGGLREPAQRGMPCVMHADSQGRRSLTSILVLWHKRSARYWRNRGAQKLPHAEAGRRDTCLAVNTISVWVLDQESRQTRAIRSALFTSLLVASYYPALGQTRSHGNGYCSEAAANNDTRGDAYTLDERPLLASVLRNQATDR
jgi:hypothetical protein